MPKIILLPNFLKIYGFVEKIDAFAIKALLLNFKMSVISSAKSSGCNTFSGFPSVIFRSDIVISVAIVLGVKVVTRIFSFLISYINDSEKPITADLEALYADEFALPFKPAVDAILIMSPLPCAFINGIMAFAT